MTRLLAITGPDGAGKSTLVDAVAAQWTGACVVRIWDALSDMPLKGPTEAYLADLGALARSLFLMHAVARSLEKAERSGATVLLLDGYWYKYAVSESLMGGAPKIWEECPFPRPERVWFLGISPEEAARRRAVPTAYERGFGAGDDAFLSFQRRTRSAWDALEARVGPWEHLDGGRPTEELVRAILEAR